MCDGENGITGIKATDKNMEKLMLNMPFVSLNEYINAERSNKQYAAKIKKQQTTSVYYLTRNQKFKLEPRKYDIIFTWIKPDNLKDHDNISYAKKFILDGIVKAGVLPSDNPNYIGNFRDIFVIDKMEKYVSCQVEFVEAIE